MGKIWVEPLQMDDMDTHMVSDYCLRCGDDFKATQMTFLAEHKRKTSYLPILICKNCRRESDIVEKVTIYLTQEYLGMENKKPLANMDNIPNIASVVKRKGFVKMNFINNKWMPILEKGFPKIISQKTDNGKWVDLSEITRPTQG